MTLETVQGSSFGATSTLVAQMGILLGMITSKQPHTALLVAAISSAASGSFGDAFSMYVSESSVNREPMFTSLYVLLSKLAIGSLYIGIFLLFKKPETLLISASILTCILLILLSNTLVQFSLYLLLTILVVIITASLGTLF